MISAWQSLTVSPLRLSSSPLTQRFPDNKNEREGEGKKDKFNVKKTRQCGASRFSGDLVASAL